MSSFRSFACLMLAVICLDGFCADARSSMPNILFIAADDLNNDLGAYGNTVVKTPNLDRLAKMGVCFDRAYCQYPLCGPSRVSIMTGLRPNTSGYLRNNQRLREVMPDVETMGQFFQKQGYYTARVGKIFHLGNPGEIGTDGDDDVVSWDERFNPSGMDHEQEEKITRYPGGTSGRKGALGVSLAWWDPVSRDDEHGDGMVASKAIELIEKKRTKPFYIAVGFYRPHCPYVAPKQYFDLYPLDSITLQPLDEAKRDLADVPALAYSDMKHWPYYFEGVTYEEARQSKRAYYACISFVDAQVGRLLEALERNQLIDTTIVVFWSDHGYFIGEKGLWFKSKNFERSARVPLLMAGPGITRGQTSGTPVELVDLYPTLVDMAGLRIPAHLEGRSLRPLLEEPARSWDKPAVTQMGRGGDSQGYSLRTERWRFIEWIDKNGADIALELYDHHHDPDEVTNLAQSPGYAEVVAGLRAQVKTYIKLPVGSDRSSHQ